MPDRVGSPTLDPWAGGTGRGRPAFPRYRNSSAAPFSRGEAPPERTASIHISTPLLLQPPKHPGLDGRVLSSRTTPLRGLVLLARQTPPRRIAQTVASLRQQPWWDEFPSALRDALEAGLATYEVPSLDAFRRYLAFYVVTSVWWDAGRAIGAALRDAKIELNATNPEMADVLLGWSLTAGGSDIRLFLDAPSMVMVLGGTMAVTLVNWDAQPASVQLVTLIAKGGRELPIQPDLVGLRPQLPADEHITLTGPEPLALVLGKGSNRSSRQQQGAG